MVMFWDGTGSAFTLSSPTVQEHPVTRAGVPLVVVVHAEVTPLDCAAVMVNWIDDPDAPLLVKAGFAVVSCSPTVVHTNEPER